MTETTDDAGGGEARRMLSIKIPESLFARLDALARERVRGTGLTPNRTETVVRLLVAGLEREGF